MTTAAERKRAEIEKNAEVTAAQIAEQQGVTDDTKPRRTKAEIMYGRLGRISKQLRSFAAGLDEDEDGAMLDNATKAVALVRVMRHDLVVDEGPLTDTEGVTVEATVDVQA